MTETSTERYHRKADECRQAAEQATNGMDRNDWLKLADEWLKLAEGAGDTATPTTARGGPADWHIVKGGF
jgi:hypothetical protein